MTDATPAFVVDDNKSDNSRPRFFMKAVKNNFKTDAAGHPVFDEREFVEILVPGDRKTVFEGLVRKQDKERWPREYDAFKAGQELPAVGFALEEWPAITRSQVEELKFAFVRTVEQLAALPDDALNKTISMGGFALREKAKRWLLETAGHSQTEALAAESARKDAIIATMEQQYADLSKRVDAILAQKTGASE